MTLSRARHRNGWTINHAWLAAALASLGVVVSFHAWRDMVRIAIKDEESSHAFLVPLVVLWLCWVRRERLRHCRQLGTWVGPLLVLVGWSLFWIGDAYLFQSLWHGGAILILIGCVLTVLGKQVMLRFLPALFALFFIVPVPGRLRQHIAIPLQNATAQVTEKIFVLGGVPVVRSGNLLTYQGVDVSIGETCNGLRMMLALALVSYTFTFGQPLRPYVRFIIIAASPLSAVVCNVMRLVSTVWVYGNHPGFADQFHGLSGWVMLAISFVLLMGIIRLLRWAAVPVTQFTLAYD